jgi:hypothetical protein
MTRFIPRLRVSEYPLTWLRSLPSDAKVSQFIPFRCRYLKPFEPGSLDGGGEPLRLNSYNSTQDFSIPGDEQDF